MATDFIGDLHTQDVRITGVDIPFGDLCGLIFKSSLAALVLLAAGALVGGVVALLVTGRM